MCAGSTNAWMPLGIGNVSNLSTNLSASASVLFIFQLVPTHSGRLFGEVIMKEVPVPNDYRDALRSAGPAAQKPSGADQPM